MPRKRSLGLLGIAVASALALVAPTGAAPNPENTCAGGVKIEDPADGTYAVALDGQTGSITLDVDEADQTFAFTSAGDLSSWTSVIVKGGPGALTFGFDPAVSSAGDLHAPVNLHSGEFYGLSHVCFFPAPDGGGEGGEGGEE